MPKKDNKFDEDYAARKKPFKTISKVGIESNGAEDTIFKTALERKKSSKEKTSSNDDSPKRVSDFLKSMSKFDEDVARLRGFESTHFKLTNDSVNLDTIEEIEEELKTFSVSREKIKSDLDTLITNINQISNILKKEDEKIQKIKIKIRREKEIAARQGD